MMSKIIYMPVNNNSMRELLQEQKPHFRKISNYWQSRLMGKDLTDTIIEFHNGYSLKSPRIQFELKSVYHHEGHYRIKLGKRMNMNDAAEQLVNQMIDEMLADSVKLIN